MHAELIERLDTIERMIQEGRWSIGRWGWAYVMWGVGHFLGAVATVTLPAERAELVWGILMFACGITMGIAGFRRRKNQQVKTLLERALSAVWWSFGLLLVFLFLALPNPNSWAGWYAFFCAVYGGAFFASGHILKWLPMKANGLLWWAAGIALKFLGTWAVMPVFAGMALLGGVGFGLYAMAHERKVLVIGS